LNLIQRDETTEFIYLAQKDGKQMRAEKRLVKTGQSYAGYVEILEGLQAGESIVLVGYQSLVNGQPLEILQ
jgi:multidrug efflux pump subunit AcrA (membrane-fusion protein)